MKRSLPLSHLCIKEYVHNFQVCHKTTNSCPCAVFSYCNNFSHSSWTCRDPFSTFSHIQCALSERGSTILVCCKLCEDRAFRPPKRDRESSNSFFLSTISFLFFVWTFTCSPTRTSFPGKNKEGILDQKDCHFGRSTWIHLHWTTIRKGSLIDSINRRNDYSNQRPSGWSWS